MSYALLGECGYNQCMNLKGGGRMYGLLALLTGLVLSVMVSVNGILSESYGVFRASVLNHVVGILFACLLWAVR